MELASTARGTSEPEFMVEPPPFGGIEEVELLVRICGMLEPKYLGRLACVSATFGRKISWPGRGTPGERSVVEETAMRWVMMQPAKDQKAAAVLWTGWLRRMDAIHRPPELRTLGEIVGAEWRDSTLPEPTWNSWKDGWCGPKWDSDGEPHWYRKQRKQDLPAVQRRLAQGADPNDPAESGTDTFGRGGVAPLWLAAELGFDQVVDALLDAKADIGWVHPHGETALHAAARNDVYSIRFFDQKSKSDTLQTDTVLRATRVVRSLATRGGQVAVNARVQTEEYSRGWTPLHCAAALGQLHAAQVLLKAGADWSLRSAAGETALDRATLQTTGPQSTGRSDVEACIRREMEVSPIR